MTRRSVSQRVSGDVSGVSHEARNSCSAPNPRPLTQILQRPLRRYRQPGVRQPRLVGINCLRSSWQGGLPLRPAIRSVRHTEIEVLGRVVSLRQLDLFGHQINTDVAFGSSDASSDAP